MTHWTSTPRPEGPAKPSSDLPHIPLLCAFVVPLALLNHRNCLIYQYFANRLGKHGLRTCRQRRRMCIGIRRRKNSRARPAFVRRDERPCGHSPGFRLSPCGPSRSSRRSRSGRAEPARHGANAVWQVGKGPVFRRSALRSNPAQFFFGPIAPTPHLVAARPRAAPLGARTPLHVVVAATGY